MYCNFGVKQGLSCEKREGEERMELRVHRNPGKPLDVRYLSGGLALHPVLCITRHCERQIRLQSEQTRQNAIVPSAVDLDSRSGRIGACEARGRADPDHRQQRDDPVQGTRQRGRLRDNAGRQELLGLRGSVADVAYVFLFL